VKVKKQVTKSKLHMQTTFNFRQGSFVC